MGEKRGISNFEVEVERFVALRKADRRISRVIQVVLKGVGGIEGTGRFDRLGLSRELCCGKG